MPIIAARRTRTTGLWTNRTTVLLDAARNVELLGNGALHTLRFLRRRPPGLYTMADVLGL